MTDEKISREELDKFSANILINLALINAAALAGTLSSPDIEIARAPFAVGLISALLSQLLWFGDSAFDHLFGEARDKLNKIIEVFTSLAILVFGATAAASIMYGCLSLIGFSGGTAIILSVAICFFPLPLLFYKTIREHKYRTIK